MAGAAAAAGGGDDVPVKDKPASRMRNKAANDKAALRLRALAIKYKYPNNLADKLKEAILRDIDDPAVISELCCEATDRAQLRAAVKPYFRLGQ